MNISKKKKGSAMIIVMSVVSLVTIVVASISGQLLVEHNTNTRFLDALVAQYGAQAGVWWGIALDNEEGEKNREVNLQDGDKQEKTLAKGSVFYSPQGDVSFNVEGTKAQTLNIEGSGNLSLRLEEISLESGASCPAPQDIFIYLVVEDQNGGRKTLNGLANSAGIWPEGNNDHAYYLPLSQNQILFTPIFAKSFIPSGNNYNMTQDYLLSSDCRYNTKWQVVPDKNQNVSNIAVIRGEGLYRESKQIISISKP